MLALPERALAGTSVPIRVLVLRIIGAVAGALLLYFGAESLFSELGMCEPYKSAAVFCVLSSQLTWATIAHVANDWLAVSITVWSLTMAVRYWKRPHFQTAAWVAGLLSLGLLTKAYFIALIPAALALCLVMKRWKDLCVAAAIILVAAGPWYTRNVLRYGVIMGMQESRAGIDATEVIHAVAALDWPRVLVTSVRAHYGQGTIHSARFRPRH